LSGRLRTLAAPAAGLRVAQYRHTHERRERMNVSTHRIEIQGRLGEAMALLDPQSRRLMELWLGGLTREEITNELKLCKETVSTIIAMVFKQLRMLLAK